MSGWLASPSCGRSMIGLMAVLGAGCGADHSDLHAESWAVASSSLVVEVQERWTASDGLESDHFGQALAMSADTAVVGVPDVDDNGDRSGAVYVFSRDDSGWQEEQKLTAEDGAADDRLGGSVAVFGDTAIAGSMFNDGAGADSGAAYVFSRDGNGWAQQQKLVASDGEPDDWFGARVALYGDTAMVGAIWDNATDDNFCGSVYVYQRLGLFWVEQGKLVAKDGECGEFGGALAISDAGDTALIGAKLHGATGDRTGAAYVFRRVAGTWSQQQKLIVSDGEDGDRFGASIAISPSGQTALIGAPEVPVGGLATGAVYVFTRSGSTWTFATRLTSTDVVGGGRFGASVALADDLAVVSAPRNGGPAVQAGSVHLFVPSEQGWSELATVRASDATSDDYFGSSIALSTETLLVGAYYADADQLRAGAVYRLLLRWPDGQACEEASDCASGHCVDQRCCDTPCGDGVLDDCLACSTAAGAWRDGLCGPVANGMDCEAEGTCVDGACVTASGAGGAGGEAAGPTEPESSAGCGCVQARRASVAFHGWLMAGLVLGVAPLRRCLSPQQGRQRSPCNALRPGHGIAKRLGLQGNLLLVTVLLAGCNTMFGIDDLSYQQDGGHAGGQGAGGDTTGSLPAALASDQLRPYAVALAGDSLVFTTEGAATIMRASLAGGDLTSLVPASTEGRAAGVAVAGEQVYWTDPEAGAVMAVPLAGGDSRTVATGLDSPHGITLDAESVYWTDVGAGTVMTVSISGGDPTALAAGQAGPCGIAVDAAHVYWANYGAGTLMRVAITGGAPQELASQQGNPWRVAVHGGSLFWLDPGAGTVMKLPLDPGGADPVTLASQQPAPSQLAVDSTGVYWTDVASGWVMTVPLGGGEPQRLAEQQAGPAGIATDGAAVYWANYLGHAVMTLAK